MFWKVLKKEIIDLLRDRKSLAIVAIPLLLFPLFIGIYNYQIIKNEKKDPETICVSIIGNENEMYNTVNKFFKDNGMEFEAVNSNDPEKEILDGKISLIFDFTDVPIIVYNQNSIKSTNALSKVVECIEYEKNIELMNVFQKVEISENPIERYSYICKDLSEYSKKASNNILALVAPLLLIMIVSSSGSGMATDLFAGEKERGSLEGILITQVDRKVLYTAKLTLVFMYTLLSSIISILSYVISFIAFPRVPKMLGINSKVTFFQFAALSLLMLLFAILCTAVLSFISISSSTVRESQTKLGIITIIPSIIGCFIFGIELSNVPLWTYGIPIFNAILCIREILLDTARIERLLLFCFSTLAISIIFVILGVRRINNEKVLK